MIFGVGQRADPVREFERAGEVGEPELPARAVRCRRASRRCQSGTCDKQRIALGIGHALCARA